MALILSLPCPFIVTAQGLSTKNLGSCLPHPTTLPHLRSWYLSYLSLGEVTQLKWWRVTHLAPACLGISCRSHFEESSLMEKTKSSQGWEALPSPSFLSVLPPFRALSLRLPSFLFFLQTWLPRPFCCFNCSELLSSWQAPATLISIPGYGPLLPPVLYKKKKITGLILSVIYAHCKNIQKIQSFLKEITHNRITKR